MVFDKFDEYVEDLLLAQYRVSEIVEHPLTRGEIREEFIRHQIEQRYEHMRCYTGIIAEDAGNQQSGQLDLIIAKRTAEKRTLGNHAMIAAEDAVFVIEVKSNATGTDFKNLDERAAKYKTFTGGVEMSVGMFCYFYDLKMRNILKRLGYAFDEEMDGFVLSTDIVPKYKNIDFIIALDNDEDSDTGQSRAFFAIKDETQEDTVFRLFQNRPVSKHFFKLIKRGLE